MHQIIDQLSRIQQIRDLKDQSLIESLIRYLDYLIKEDFEKLVQILYRLDVSEPLLKQSLREHPDTAAAELIAQLIIERKEKAIRTKETLKSHEEGDWSE